MSAPLVTLTDIKQYLGKTGTDDDLLIASIASNATAMAERDTGRIFAVSSNVTRRYSTDGQASITIHDRPYNDSTRTVTLAGAPMTEGTNVWFLPDRRNPDVSTTIQIRPYTQDWYARSFYWFDANLDNPKYLGMGGYPNDLVISGTEGHPVTQGDVLLGIGELACWLYWRAKGGVSSYASSLTGDTIDLSTEPDVYKNLIRNWKIATSVVAL